MKIGYSLALTLSFLVKIIVPQERIYGGREGNREDAPYAVEIRTKSSGCSGSLIAADWVLSAGHCFYQLGASRVEVNVKHQTLASRKVSRVIIHPDYWHNRVAKHDLALAKLESPFPLSKDIGILQLSNETWPEDRQNAVDCMAFGYGKTESSGPGKSFKVLGVKGRHGETACPGMLTFQARRLVCITEGDGKGICHGDSGSALVCSGKGVGVAHMLYDKRSFSFFAIPDLQCGSRYTVGSYIYICPYLDWIRSYVPNMPKTPISCRSTSLLSNWKVVVLLALALWVTFYRQ